MLGFEERTTGSAILRSSERAEEYSEYAIQLHEPSSVAEPGEYLCHMRQHWRAQGRSEFLGIKRRTCVSISDHREVSSGPSALIISTDVQGEVCYIGRWFTSDLTSYTCMQPHSRDSTPGFNMCNSGSQPQGTKRRVAAVDIPIMWARPLQPVISSGLRTTALADTYECGPAGAHV